MPEHLAAILRRFPLLAARVIDRSNGYASPQLAAQILDDARAGRSNGCEWLMCCYGCDPRRLVRQLYRDRHLYTRSQLARAISLIRLALSRDMDWGELATISCLYPTFG